MLFIRWFWIHICLILFLSACDGTGSRVKKDIPVTVHEENDPFRVSSTRPWLDKRQHTHFEDNRFALHQSVSHDGKYIVYSSTEYSKNAQIFIKPTKGNAAPTRITFNHGNNLYPSISPDGSQVAFTSDKDGDRNIYIVNLKHSTGIIQVTLSPYDEIAPCWSPDGKRILYSFKSTTDQWILATIHLETQENTILGPGVNAVWSPAVGLHANRIAFQKNDPMGNPKIMTLNADGSDVREFELWTEGSSSHPVWSPDGEWIAFVSRTTTDRSAIQLIRLDGSDRLKMFDNANPKEHISWGGNRIYFVMEEGKRKNIYSVQLLPLNLLDK